MVYNNLQNDKNFVWPEVQVFFSSLNSRKLSLVDKSRNIFLWNLAVTRCNGSTLNSLKQYKNYAYWLGIISLHSLIIIIMQSNITEVVTASL